MQISQKGINFIKKYEEFRATPYYATPAEKRRGICTIGYGSTVYPDGRPVKITDAPITEELAAQMLQQTIAEKYEPAVRRLVTVPVSQNQWDMLVSLCYNIGTAGLAQASTIVHINRGNFTAAAAAFSGWVKQTIPGRGKVTLRGLVRRRAEEAMIFLQPDEVKVVENIPVKMDLNKTGEA